MCYCENIPSYQPFYDGKYFSDGERCNGIVFFSDDNVYFQAVGADGELHERGDEEPILFEFETEVAEIETNVANLETISTVIEKWVCENCNQYKPSEIKKHGEIYACARCRGKLVESAVEKAQLSLFWEQGRLF